MERTENKDAEVEAAKSFNETLKRMLKTPPAPKQSVKPGDKDKPPHPAKKS